MVIFVDITIGLSGKAPSLTEGVPPHNREVRLAYGPSLDPFSLLFGGAKLSSIHVTAMNPIRFENQYSLLKISTINDDFLVVLDFRRRFWIFWFSVLDRNGFGNLKPGGFVSNMGLG